MISFTTKQQARNKHQSKNIRQPFSAETEIPGWSKNSPNKIKHQVCVYDNQIEE